MDQDFKLLSLLQRQEEGWVNPTEVQKQMFNFVDVVAYNSYFKKILPDERIKDFVSPDWLKFSEKHDVKTFTKYATYRGCARNVPAMMKSIRKCDVEYKCPPLDATFWFVFQLTLSYLKPHLTIKPTKNFAECDFNMKALPGEPYQRLGFKSKAEAFRTLAFLQRIRDYDPIIYYLCFQKIELLLREELEKPTSDTQEDINKRRTIFNPPLDFLARCAEIFDQQNDLFMKFAGLFWSAYGMNKWHGGFDKVFKQFGFSGCDEGDVSGYDRVAQLWIVYALRHACLMLNGLQEVQYQHCMYNIVNSYITTPIGLLLFLTMGNRSGSRNTASDNTILHIFIKMYIIVTFYKKKLGKLPNIMEIEKVFKCIVYSDDYFNNIDLEALNTTQLEWMEHQRYIYDLFGMIRKPKTIIESRMEGKINCKHTFLGSYVYYSSVYKKYYPVPKLDKVTSSAIYTIERKQVIFTISRIMALIVLTSWDLEHEEIYQTLVAYLRFLYHEHLEEIPKEHAIEVKNFVASCGDRSFFVYQYFGLESGTKEGKFDSEGSLCESFLNFF